MTRPNPPSAVRAGLDHWLALCLACILLWGVWAFLSKVLADRVGAIETQLLFTLGMLPAGLIAAWRVGAATLVTEKSGGRWLTATGADAAILLLRPSSNTSVKESALTIR